jgi:quercetin dioxygenase-like cupin family protein
LATDAPEDSIVSRTVYSRDDAKLVLFTFADGQSLSEHTAARPAILHFLQGEATLTLEDQQVEAAPGTWVHMDANLPHSVIARGTVVMALLLLGPGD